MYTNQFWYFALASCVVYVLLLGIFLKRKMDWRKIFFLTLFYIYVLSVILVTLLPLPPLKANPALTPRSNLYNNLVPFSTIVQVWHRSWYVAFVNIVGNLVLTLPLGAFVFFLDRQQSFKRAVFIGFLFSVSIELMQFLVSSWIHFTYRTADIDDVILNVSGFTLGYLLTKGASTWLLQRGRLGS